MQAAIGYRRVDYSGLPVPDAELLSYYWLLTQSEVEEAQAAIALERLTKPCHRQAAELRLTMHEKKKQRSQRGAVEQAQAAVARSQAISQRRAPAAGR